VRASIGNVVVGNAIEKVRGSIKEGEGIARPMGESGMFNDVVVNMVDVGEETGELDRMLSKIADFYDEEVDVAVSALLSLMEPIMITVLGIIVGGMVVAMYLPIFKLGQAI